MNENRVYAVLLVALLGAAYVTWSRSDETPDENKVALIGGQAAGLEALTLVTTTATVQLNMTDTDGVRRGVFTTINRQGKRSFLSNETFEDAVESYAKLEALRSLGKLTKDEQSEVGLNRKFRKLALDVAGTTYRFRLGGRTNGARDHYAQREGSDEVYLLPSALIADLELPQGRYMQRKLRRADGKDVAGAVINAGDRQLEGVHKNRLAPREAYWAQAETPDDVAEALTNFLKKVETLSALSYLDGDEAFQAAEPVLELVWKGEDGQTLDTLELRREGPKGRYLARSKTTVRAVEVPRSSAAQIESDLSVILD